jgi:tRNA (guanine9-N1)-methyltransferase
MSSSLQKDIDNGKCVPTSTSDDVRAEAASVPVVATDASADDKPLSKSQMKRQRRWEQAMERKKRRKQQDKDIKMAKALSEGRDLEEERRLLEERTEEGVGHRRREEKWLQRMKSSADASFRVCIDCAYNDQMTVKELNSLALQIRYCYSCNRKSDNPVYFSVAGLAGHPLELLKKVEGFPEQWSKRAFDCSEKSLMEMHPDKSKLVYLTSDSENTVQHLEDDKMYVIGGIVDRNRLKCAAIGQAESMGIATAKLPITDYLDLVTTKVLTCNHVFEILLKYRQNGNDWKKAMLDVLPNRKGVHPKKDDEKDKHGRAEAHTPDNEADEDETTTPQKRMGLS